MRIGVSLRSAYGIDDWRTGSRWMLERARVAHAAGLDHLFVGDHHAVPVPYYQNTAILGRLLAEWTGRPAGALFLLPIWNPVLVAEQIATLSAIHDSQLILQCAIGGGEEQFAAMGGSLRTRPSAFENRLHVIRRLCAGEAVSTDRPWEMRDVRIGPPVVPEIEVWIGGHAEGALDRAARLGDVWLAGPDATVAEAGRLLAKYQERCEAHGRTPTAVAIRRDVHVGADDGDAQRVAEPVLQGGYRGFSGGQCLVGGPETVAEQILELGELGFTDVVIRHLADDQGEVLASFERLAEVRRLVASA